MTEPYKIPTEFDLYVRDIELLLSRAKLLASLERHLQGERGRSNRRRLNKILDDLYYLLHEVEWPPNSSP